MISLLRHSLLPLALCVALSSCGRGDDPASNNGAANQGNGYYPGFQGNGGAQDGPGAPGGVPGQGSPGMGNPGSGNPGSGNSGRGMPAARTSGAPTKRTPLPEGKGATKFEQRRNGFFGLKPIDVDMPGDPSLMGDVVLGVMVEDGFGEKGVVVTMAAANGETSIVTSNGSTNYTQCGRILRVAAASKDLVSLTAAALQTMGEVVDRPLPEGGVVHVYAVTPKGLRMGKASREELTRGTHALSPIYVQSRRIYGEVRAEHQRLKARQ